MQPNLVTLISAILFGIVGGFLLFYILRALLGSFSVDLRGLRERWIVKRRVKPLLLADKAIEEDRIADAVSLLEQAVCFEIPGTRKGMVQAIHNHNIAVLGRLLSVAEKRGGHLTNLPLIEGLFYSRKELLDAYGEVVAARNSLKKKRAEERKDVPEWAFDEFVKKLAALNDKLATNEHALKSSMKELLRGINEMPSSGEITYH